MLDFVHTKKPETKGIKMTEIQEIDLLRANYVRVSEIIGKQTERQMRAIPIETLTNAALRGTKIHSYCSAYLKGLWIPEVEPEYLPYFKAFTEWADENIEKTLHQNTRLYDDEKKFTGEFDCIVLMKDREGPVLIDIKTSASVSKSWPVQLAAYNYLCSMNGYYVDGICNLHLKKSKSAYVNEHNDTIFTTTVIAKEIKYCSMEKYLKIFESALLCYNYFEGKEN